MSARTSVVSDSIAMDADANKAAGEPSPLLFI